MTAYVPREGPPGPQGPPGADGAPGTGDLSSTMYTAKGAILAASAPSTVSAQPVGADNTVLTADAAQTRGMKWVKVGDAMILAGSNLAKLASVTGTPDGTKLFRDDGSWQKVADASVLAGSNLAKLAAVTGTPTGAKFLRDDGSWQLAGGSSLSYQQAALSADVSMVSAATWYDGATLSLAAGTWLVFGGITATMGSGGTGQISYRLWDGTTSVASGENSGIAASAVASGTVAGVFVLGGTTTVRVAAASSRASSLIRAAILDSPVGNNATFLVALKIA